MRDSLLAPNRQTDRQTDEEQIMIDVASRKRRNTKHRLRFLKLCVYNAEHFPPPPTFALRTSQPPKKSPPSTYSAQNPNPDSTVNPNHHLTLISLTISVISDCDHIGYITPITRQSWAADSAPGVATRKAPAK